MNRGFDRRFTGSIRWICGFRVWIINCNRCRRWTSCCPDAATALRAGARHRGECRS